GSYLLRRRFRRPEGWRSHERFTRAARGSFRRTPYRTIPGRRPGGSFVQDAPCQGVGFVPRVDGRNVAPAPDPAAPRHPAHPLHLCPLLSPEMVAARNPLRSSSALAPVHWLRNRGPGNRLGSAVEPPAPLPEESAHP